jgi:hypothetical protein
MTARAAPAEPEARQHRGRRRLPRRGAHDAGIGTGVPERALVPPIPPDPGLPGARGLFLPAGIGVVASFLAARGWTMREARPVQALYRPGRSCVVRYQVHAETPGGEPRLLTLCAETRARTGQVPPPPPEFDARYVLPDPVAQDPPYLVYAFPYDPGLEGLPDAAWGPAVREALGKLGERPIFVAAAPIRYRPRRRAVFRYLVLNRGRRGRTFDVVFGKTLGSSNIRRCLAVTGALPRQTRRVRLRRPRVRLALPMGEVGGTLLFARLPGRSLRDLLIAGERLPAPERVAGLVADLARIGDTAAEWPEDAHRCPAGDLATLVGEFLVRVEPEIESDVRMVVDAIGEAADRDAVPSRIVHGDLYEAQVFVGDEFSLGLIDLDDFGPGDPILDAANFTAHLVALALSVPAAADRLLAYRALARETFVARLDIAPHAFAWREAMAMLLLATGPFRVLQPDWPAGVAERVALAGRLLKDL